jgi:hypothetical protein
MSNLYYSPEKFGLEQVVEVDYSSGSYEFDLLVVWRRTYDGALVMAEDSGCSCPSPFEDLGVGDLTVVKPHQAAERIQQRLAERSEYSRYEETDAQAVEAIGRLMGGAS